MGDTQFLSRSVSRSRTQSGFTLVELLVVISVLGVLAGIVVFAVGGITDRGQTSACATDARTLRTAEEAHQAKTGAYTDQNGLVSAGLLSQPSTLHAVAVSGNSFTITGAGSCAFTPVTDSFEDVPPAPNSSWALWSAGSKIGAWTVNSGSVDVVDYRFWGNPATTGLSALSTIDMHGGSVGSIQRSISGLTANVAYTLTFKYAHNSAPGSSLRVRIGNLDTSITANNSAYTTKWLTATMQFTAASSTETLRLDGSGSVPWGGVTVDDFVIS